MKYHSDEKYFADGFTPMNMVVCDHLTYIRLTHLTHFV